MKFVVFLRILIPKNKIKTAAKKKKRKKERKKKVISNQLLVQKSEINILNLNRFHNKLV